MGREMGLDMGVGRLNGGVQCLQPPFRSLFLMILIRTDNEALSQQVPKGTTMRLTFCNILSRRVIAKERDCPVELLSEREFVRERDCSGEGLSGRGVVRARGCLGEGLSERDIVSERDCPTERLSQMVR